MTVHKLTDDIFEEAYTLIAIHSSLDSYRLAYFLNGLLGIQLKRLGKDLVLNQEASFAVYEAYESSTDLMWNLVSNITGVSKKTAGGTLDIFGEPGGVQLQYVLPEYPKVDHLLKIDDGEGGYQNALEVLRQIKKLPQVITAYELNTNQLKSKSNLIFLANA